jgi:hypothetical protein
VEEEEEEEEEKEKEDDGYRKLAKKARGTLRTLHCNTSLSASFKMGDSFLSGNTVLTVNSTCVKISLYEEQRTNK